MGLEDILEHAGDLGERPEHAGIEMARQRPAVSLQAGFESFGGGDQCLGAEIHAGIADGSHVADVGAGGGWFTVRLARRVGPNGVVWAEDVQAEMLEAIKRRAAKENLRNVQTQKGSPADPMLPAASLDAVLIVEAFQEIQSANPQLFLENVRASLKPDQLQEIPRPGVPPKVKRPYEAESVIVVPEKRVEVTTEDHPAILGTSYHCAER